MKRVLFALTLALCLGSLAWAQEGPGEDPNAGVPIPQDPNAGVPMPEDPNTEYPPPEDPNAEEPVPEAPVYEGSVYFEDATLKEIVEQELWVWDPTPTDMLGLTSVRAASHGLFSLTGLEYAANLSELDVPFNDISDLSPLAGLTELDSIVINNNQIGDVSALSGLTKLTHLDVHDNQISSISALSGLTNLQTLVIRLNPISDLGPMSEMSDLRDLDVHLAEVSDVSPLSGLTNLERLVLQFNQISDVSPLAGLTELRELNLRYNEISDVSPLAGLSNLQNLDLSSNQLSDIAPLAEMAGLQQLNLEGNLDLNQDAYRSHLYTIVSNGTDVRYSLHAGVPTGVVADDHTAQGWVEVTWNEVHQGPHYDVYYRVYRSIPPADEKEPVSEWQTSRSFTDTSVEPGARYAYWVRSATSDEGDNLSDYGGPSDMSAPGLPVLTLSSTAGGSVTVPGEGSFPVDRRSVTVAARPSDPSLFYFAGWTGTAVDAGKVSHPGQSNTLVTVDADCTLQAHFATFMDVLYVDDDAPSDPGAKLASRSDPQENGTALHPFDSIQEAIEVATKGTTVVVRPGVYRENLDLLGKNVHLNGFDPDGAPTAVIEGAVSGPVLSFTRGEDPNCLLTGFVISTGRSQQAGAVLCLQSSPTFVSCLIVGNRAGGSQGAAIYCQDSQAWFDNCTIADNVGGGLGGALVLDDSNVTLRNSIVWDNTPSQIVLEGDSRPSINYCAVAGGWLDVGNIETNPLFAHPGHWADPDRPKTAVDPSRLDAVWVAGDYHLKSRAGRWEPLTQSWVQDVVTSPCIDAGDPTVPVGAEPAPHGGVINLGAYGGTTQASLGQ
ncbi:MAG: leucine-rich repeat domain-containing protein [Sedimentisphaerales bacterium]|nr:leucine-rich repeat domain-containing protein [Sedimentisphaerales bacterium]